MFITTISCDFDFLAYPFDSHECIIKIKNWLGATYRLLLNMPILYNLAPDGSEVKQDGIAQKKAEKTNYDMEFLALNLTQFRDVDTFNYSMARIKMFLHRKDKARNKIFNTFHVSSGIFALLSLVSLFIHPDSVPGRMGILITLYLIMINTYNSVDAPQKRGFSHR